MKSTSRFSCQSCGQTAPKWQGQCHACGEWNTVVEEPDLGVAPARVGGSEPGTGDIPESIASLGSGEPGRISTEIAELDRVLGGGFVPGGSMLLGGEPGIGKSTLLLQAASGCARANPGAEVLLVSAEESKAQIRRRAERIGALAENLVLYCESSCEHIAAEIQRRRPIVVVVDSVQTIRSGVLSGAAGTVGQVRECAGLLTAVARAAGTCVVMVGHVTKDGALAGPRTLEHLVDSVLAFEGDRRHGLRSLRAEKNRFGPTGEVSLFEMAPSGLIEVADASARLIQDRRRGQSGSVVACTVEGHRPILVELQALVSLERQAAGRRVAIGVDSQRMALIVAVLERRAGLELGARDLYVSAAGGVRVDDPGADLPIALAVASAACDVAVGQDLAIWGEMGLGGEVRAVAFGRQRYEEAARLGFAQCLLPAADEVSKSSAGGTGRDGPQAIIGVESLEDSLLFAGLLPA